MDQVSEQENKGQYCQFVKTADGSYILKPVRVPAHVKAARAERLRKKEIRRHVEKNRKRAQAITAQSLLFMALTLSIFVAVSCLFLHLKNQTNQRLDTIAGLRMQAEQLSQENEILEKRLLVAEDLSVIETVAERELGMRQAEAGQIRYYTQDAEDYMLQYQDIAGEPSA